MSTEILLKKAQNSTNRKKRAMGTWLYQPIKVKALNGWRSMFA